MNKPEWNIITGENAPWWATMAMALFWAFTVYLANKRDNHFMIGFGALGCSHCINKLFTERAKQRSTSPNGNN